MKKILIDINEANEVGVRLDKLILNKVKEMEEYDDFFSRTRIQAIIKEGSLCKNSQIFLDNSYKTQLGDKFILIIPDPKEAKIEPKNIPLDIVYEDNDLIVVNKQAGLTTHPGAGNYSNTLVNALLYYCKDSLSGIGGINRPGIVHRLDKDTSGLMVVAKNDFSHVLLSEQIQTRILKRKYNAVIWGNINPKIGKIDGYIDRSYTNRLKMVLANSTGKYSLTNYKVLTEYNDLASLVECCLDTGRTHQIRVHFSSRKNPLIGDQIYGGNSRKVKGEKSEFTDFIERFPRQALHSKEITFFHPRTSKELCFESELPSDMKELLEYLNKYTK